MVRLTTITDDATTQEAPYSSMLPVFGSFQTIREIASDDSRVIYLAEKREKPFHRRTRTDNLREALSLIWQSLRHYRHALPFGPARSGSHRYVIVLFRVRKATEFYERDDQRIRNLGHDLQLAFLDTVKAHKRVADGGSPFMAPIHEYGVNSEGAWYATDYFRRGSLHTGIGHNRMVDDGFLRRVFGMVIGGLRDLQRQCGRSHGNLKPTKIMLAENGVGMRYCNLQLIEPLIGTEADAESFEQADVRALGCLLYQLVCLREVNSPDDINYPLQPTHEWSHLGEHAKYWRNLCNNLLADPPERSLASLAQEFPPPQPPPVAMLSSLSATVVLTFLFAWLHFGWLFTLPTDALKRLAATLGNHKATNYLRIKSEFASSLQEARDQADIGEFVNARGWLTNALSLHVNDARAERSLQAIIARQTKYDQWLATIQYFSARAKYADVLRACSNAQAIAPKAPQFDEWQARAAQLADAMSDFKAGNYGLAERKFDTAWQANPVDLTAKELRDKSARCKDNWSLFDRTNDRNTLEAVLKENPDDPRAKQQLQRSVENAVAYVDHLKKAGLASDRGEYALAVSEFEAALAIRSDAEIKTRLDEAKSLKALHEQADALFAQQQWAAAQDEYGQLFRRNPKDTLAETRLRECLKAAAANK